MALTTPPVVIEHGQEQTFAVRALVGSGTTASIDRGTPTKKSSTNVAICVNHDGTSSQLLTGIAKGASTETSGASGAVELWVPVPGLVYRVLDKTSTNSNTQAKIDALFHKRVQFDLTGSTWTVDSAITDAASNGIVIVGGNPLTSELEFLMTPVTTYFGNVTT